MRQNHYFIKTYLLRIILTAILIAPVYRQETDGFVNMFNGKDLNDKRQILSECSYSLLFRIGFSVLR